jgi:hypothetical protein
MSEPVSWLMVEKGWQVLDRDGVTAGHVMEVLGNEQLDIFDGLVIRHHRFDRKHYVPAERVARIVRGQVTLDLSESEIPDLKDS